MAEKRKPMMSAEELEFLGKKDNGFQKAAKPAAAAKKPAKPEPDKVDSDPVDPFDEDLGTIESLKKKPKSREPRVRFTVDMSERMHAKLRALSADKNVRMTKLVRMAVADLIARLEED